MSRGEVPIATVQGPGPSGAPLPSAWSGSRPHLQQVGLQPLNQFPEWPRDPHGRWTQTSRTCLVPRWSQSSGERDGHPGKGIKAWGAADPDLGSFLSPPAGSRGGGLRKSGHRRPNTPGSAEPRTATFTITRCPWAKPGRVKRQERKARAGEGSDLLRRGLTGQVRGAGEVALGTQGQRQGAPRGPGCSVS